MGDDLVNSSVSEAKTILFFLVHPAKFHFHRVQINELRARGHTVDIIITKKDILEDLVREEGWEYTNIFPEGRKIPGLHVYLAAGISLIRTVSRLWQYTRRKKYDLFVGDLLTVLGRLKRVPSLYPTDNELAQVPEQAVFLATCDWIISPRVTDLGRFKAKKVPYDGFKALAHLHPNHFQPDKNRLREDLRVDPFFLIRCVGFNATHDIDKHGIGDDILRSLVPLLQERGRVLITSERPLPRDLQPYLLDARKSDIAHYLFYAEMFIGDSTTMGAEAAVLGTPSIEFDNYFEEIEQTQELEDVYGLNHCVSVTRPDELLAKVKEFLDVPHLKETFRGYACRLISEKIDVSAYLVWFMENYPDSLRTVEVDPNYQYRFR